MQTNITELELHLKNTVGKVFRTKQFENRVRLAGDRMQEQVQKALNTNGRYDFQQSYRLKREIDSQTADWEIKQTSVKIGFGHIPSLNKYTKRPAQSATFKLKSGETKTIGLREEKDLPSWIIMEFGRKGSANKAGRVPTFIKQQSDISYTPREKKTLLFGPSTSNHFKKKVFFMTNATMLTRHHPEIPKSQHKSYRKHPGIEEGKFFRTGLKNAKPLIFDEITVGIYHSLAHLSRVNGGSGEVKIL